MGPHMHKPTSYMLPAAAVEQLHGLTQDGETPRDALVRLVAQADAGWSEPIHGTVEDTGPAYIMGERVSEQEVHPSRPGLTPAPPAPARPPAPDRKHDRPATAAGASTSPR